MKNAISSFPKLQFLYFFLSHLESICNEQNSSNIRSSEHVSFPMTTLWKGEVLLVNQNSKIMLSANHEERDAWFGTSLGFHFHGYFHSLPSAVLGRITPFPKLSTVISKVHSRLRKNQ